MQRQRKQLLGLAGLALVGIMTAVACVISAPGAGAVGESGEVTVKVQVANPGTVPEVKIQDFTYRDTDSVFRKVFNVKVSYVRTTDLKVYLKNTGSAPAIDVSGASLFAINPDPEADELSIDTSTCGVSFSETEQVCELTFDLAQAAGEFFVPGTMFSARAVAVNGGVESIADDTMAFAYREAFLMSFGGQYVANGDPIMEAVLSENVKFAAIEVFDEAGNRVPIPANKTFSGNDYYTLDLSQMKDGSLKFALPLWEAKAADGKYKVVLITYDTAEPTDDSLNGMAMVDNVPYKKINTSDPGTNPEDPNKPGGPNNPNTPDRPVEPGKPGKPDEPDEPGNPDNPDEPEAPDTGLNLFKDLNISRADYIITGLVAFGLVTGFAIFLIVRRNKR